MHYSRIYEVDINVLVITAKSILRVSYTYRPIDIKSRPILELGTTTKRKQHSFLTWKIGSLSGEQFSVI
jgi:hypothetical protein